MTSSHRDEFVSRAGAKLAHALDVFSLSPVGWVCADLGCSTGGFTDCLLKRGAAKVYSVDRGYGVIDYKLRSDPRIVVMERTDARHIQLPEKVNLVTIDAGWTRQALVLPTAIELLSPGGRILSLIKPQYEAEQGELREGILPDELAESILSRVRPIVASLGLQLLGATPSPIRGQAGNQEFLWLLA